MPDAQSKTFWSFLILVDVLLMVSFGWALADRVYNLLEEPVTAPMSARLPKARVFEQARAASAAADARAKQQLAIAASTAAARPAVAAQPAPAPEPAKDDTPQASSNRAKKVVFSYHNDHAKTVMIAAGFNHWRATAMERKNGTWTYTVFLLPGLTYPYRFIVDGRKMADPSSAVKKWGRSYRKVE